MTASDGYTPNEVLRGLLRFFVAGPILGATIGALQTLAAVQVWIDAGQPDFYFRGWSGVDLHLQVQTFAGAVVGIPYGITVRAYELFASRRVRLLLYFWLVVFLAYGVSWIVVSIEFHQRSLFGFPLNAQLLAALFGWILLPLVSRRKLV